MKNKFLKKAISIIAVCSLASCMGMTAIHAESPSAIGNGNVGIMPLTWYLSGGEIAYQKLNSNTMRVQISTTANTRVTSLYHDVVIYKNGTKVYSGRRSGSNNTILVTYNDFSASENDFFSTYVTHYVSNNGQVEHCDSHEDAYF